MSEDTAAEIVRALERLADCMNNWTCFCCGNQMTAERQIGRCVYAVPCGCRLWQGTARGQRPDTAKDAGQEANDD